MSIGEVTLEKSAKWGRELLTWAKADKTVTWTRVV